MSTRAAHDPRGEPGIAFTGENRAVVWFDDDGHTAWIKDSHTGSIRSQWRKKGDWAACIELPAPTEDEFSHEWDTATPRDPTVTAHCPSRCRGCWVCR